MFEEVYSSDWRPDVTRSLDVLAFLLVPLAVFLDGVSLCDVAEIRETLDEAKRLALVAWYASRKVSA